MKIAIYCFGAANEPYVKEGIMLFEKRIKHYYPIEWHILPPPKNAGKLTTDGYKDAEALQLHNKLTKEDYIVCLDENGKMLSSPELGLQLIKASNQSAKRIVFIIGGAYGIATTMLQKTHFVWSLSKLVFPHQLVRLILAEQLYRACTINNNEKYHH